MSPFHSRFIVLTCMFCLLFSMYSYDDKDAIEIGLFDKFIESKGYSTSIHFDSSNIKQYWVDKTVLNKDGFINVQLNLSKSSDYISIPLRIQLANVSYADDCIISIFSDTELSFFVTNSNGNVCASSKPEPMYLGKYFSSLTLHLEDTVGFIFFLNFVSKDKDVASINKIFLSFSENMQSSFLYHPGTLSVTRNNISFPNNNLAFVEKEDTISVKGHDGALVVDKKIIVSNNPINTSVKIKNIGTQQTRVSIGYAPYNVNFLRINKYSFPYKDVNKIHKIVSAKKGQNTVILDSVPNWERNTYIALNAREDLSDLPNSSILNQSIQSVEVNDNGEALVRLSRNLQEGIPPLTKVRIHQIIGAKYMYTANTILNPGDEFILVSSTIKDDSVLQYPHKSFCKGTLFVQPILLVQSVGQKEDSIVQISDYNISY